MKIHFQDIVLRTLEGEPIVDAYKAIANTIYFNTRNLDLVERAIMINRGDEVEINEEEKKEIIGLITKNHPAFILKAVLDFFEKNGENK